jgi:hypothetical protein
MADSTVIGPALAQRPTLRQPEAPRIFVEFLPRSPHFHRLQVFAGDVPGVYFILKATFPSHFLVLWQNTAVRFEQ